MDSCHHTPRPPPPPPPSQSLHTKSRIERRRFALPLVFWGGGALFWCCPLRSGLQEESVRKSLDHRELFDFAHTQCHTVIPLKRKTGAQNDCADFFPSLFLGRALRDVNKNLKSAGPSYGTSAKSVLKPPRPCAAAGGFSPY